MSQVTVFGTSGTYVTAVGAGVGINLTGTATHPIVNLTVPVSIISGGTNNTSFTDNSLLYFDGVKFANIANGSAGTVLTSNGALPASFQSLPPITITGTAGTPLSGSSFTLSGGTSGAVYTGSGSTMTTSFAGLLANGGNINLSTDSVSSNINIGTGNESKAIVIGSTFSTSTTDIKTGNGSLSLTTTGGSLSLNSTTGTVNVSSDASNTTVNIATGAGNKIVTLGSTSGSSKTDIRSGSANVTINGGLKVSSTGVNTNPIQPAFRAYVAFGLANATGDATVVLMPYDGVEFDQASNYNNTAGVYAFTAPVTGRYMIGCTVYIDTIDVSNSVMVIDIVTTTRTYSTYSNPYYEQAIAGPGPLVKTQSVLASMSAGDTVHVNLTVSGGPKTVNVQAGNGLTSFWAYLAC